MREIEYIEQEVTLEELDEIDIGDEGVLEASGVVTTEFEVTEKHEYAEYGRIKLERKGDES